jgi:hypothetical protein
VDLPSWTSLVETARWAPSPHNIQPWRLRVLDARRAELLCDGGRLLTVTDPSGRFTMVGLGIFLETLAIAARADGADVEAEYALAPLVAGPGLLPFAELRLVPALAPEPLPRELIARRRTSRLPYDGRPVEPERLRELERVAAAWGQTATFVSDPELVPFVVDLNRETLFYDLTDEAARAEIGVWLRFSARSAAETGDGFSPAALGFPGWLLRLFFHARGAFELPVVRTAVRRLYARTMQGTRTIGWLEGLFETPEDWIRSGRMLARLWLTMTARDVYLHPFGSIVTNESANRRLLERIPHDPKRGMLWLVFRLGRSDQPPRSHRLRTDELLVG